MSYSLTTAQPTKAAAVADLMRQFDQLVVPQFPIHSADRAAIQANLNAALGMLATDPTVSIAAGINGSITTVNGAVTSCSISSFCSNVAGTGAGVGAAVFSTTVAG